jgi:hypothetical protein
LLVATQKRIAITARSGISVEVRSIRVVALATSRVVGAGIQAILKSLALVTAAVVSVTAIVTITTIVTIAAVATIAAIVSISRNVNYSWSGLIIVPAVDKRDNYVTRIDPDLPR